MWRVLGAPLDSSGTSRGEERAPDALRSAGLSSVFDASDRGDVVAPLRDPVRDLRTGVIGFNRLCASSDVLRERTAATLSRGERPLVLGGDCCVLLGAVAGARDAVGEVALWFVDGHADFLDGATSPTGEAADMELAIITGDGPKGLVDLGGHLPLVEAANVAVLGHRPGRSDPDVAMELGRVPGSITRTTAEQIMAIGAGQVGARIAHSANNMPAWLHIDLDTLDEAALNAVTYPQPHGLDWESFVALLRPMLASPSLVGLSLADFNPDLDPDGSAARRVVTSFARALT